MTSTAIISAQERESSLTHYGIRGQKWGVRRFQNENGSLTEEGKKRYAVTKGGVGNKKFERKVTSEFRKLDKLRDRADVDLQAKKAKDYDKKASVAAKVGTGFAVAGALLAARQSGRAAAFWHRPQPSTGQRVKDVADRMYYKEWEKYNLNKASLNNTLVAMSAAAATASYGTAAYYKTRAVIAKKRVSEIGHSKAVRKYQDQIKRIENMVSGTTYSDLLKKQIEAYKKEHPNSELSDKEIANNLR